MAWRTYTMFAALRALCASLLLASQSASGQCHYRATVLPRINCGLLGMDSGVPTAINSFGQVAGRHSQCFGYGDNAFGWKPGQQTLGTLQRPTHIVSAYANAITNVLGTNGLGQVAGECLTTNPAQYRAFIWQDGQWFLPDTGQDPSPSGIAAMNDHGMAVGYTAGPNANVASIWITGRLQQLSLPYGIRSYALSVNQSGAVVGWMGEGPGFDSHAYLWRQGAVTDLGIPGGFLTSRAVAINNRDEVIVSGVNGPETLYLQRSYLWHDGQWTDLGMPQGQASNAAIAFNDRTEIVGRAWTPVPGSNHSSVVDWVWRNGAFTDISTVILPGSGILGGIPHAINNDGQIVLEGGDFIENYTVILTPVPDHQGDTDCNGLVNIDDLVNVITDWGPCTRGFCSTDLDGNGIVNVLDLVTVLSNWDFGPR